MKKFTLYFLTLSFAKLSSNASLWQKHHLTNSPSPYKIFYFIVASILCTLLPSASTSQSPGANHHVINSSSSDSLFTVKDPDYKLSPHTGMTRKHWEDAAMYLLSGAFSHVKQLEDPMVFPKQPGKSYPREPWQERTEKLEGLCRTLLLAAPLLKEDPLLTIGTVKLGEYYRYHLKQLINPASNIYITPRAANGSYNQNLVEFGALALCLFILPEQLWEPLSGRDKDSLAKVMLSYGDGPTVPSNWKFFNIFVLSFFKKQGYTVNEKLLQDYLQKSLDHYRGDGWYNDNPAYDYYSMWAFQMYGTLWAEFFGKEFYPDLAKSFLINLKPIATQYPAMFAKDGSMIMWGRSISYRFGAIVPMPLLAFTDVEKADYGWMRRICSGSLLQFLQHPDFLQDRVPALGFYGPFEPAVQSYSCRASVYWLSKAFLALLVPADHDFWNARETIGSWETEFADGNVHLKFSQGAQILVADYPTIGASEIRAWCHVPLKGAGEPFRGSENYNRLSYNSAFPWQADGENGEVAMNYIFKNHDQRWEAGHLFTFKKFEDGVYYRDLVMESNPEVNFQLAEMPLANGILRIDKYTGSTPVEMRLGHYALPKLKGNITTQNIKVKGYTATIISNGKYDLALVPLSGWKNTEVVKCVGLHPESVESTVLNHSHKTTGVRETNIFATLMLWKKAGEPWTKKELLPVKLSMQGAADKIQIFYPDNTSKSIQY